MRPSPSLCNRANALFFFLIAQLSILSSSGQATQGQNANGVLGQLIAAFSPGIVVQQVQMMGTATWNAGSLQDSGTVSLTASTGGSSQMRLDLSSLGQKTETQTGAGESADCQWSGADAVVHEVDATNCWRPALWFLPALSFQPSLLPNYLGVVDLGIGTVGSGTQAYRHLQSQFMFSDLTSPLATKVTEMSATDLGLDPTSLLPAVLAYSIHPNDGSSAPIAIEIHYSNYQTVNGVQIPFLIERYLNGSLQLTINVSSAQIN